MISATTQRPALIDQFDQVVERWPDAWLDAANSVLVVPDLPLIDGWNKSSTTVRFVVPEGYPFVCPRHFYADGDLMLAGNGCPQVSRLTGPRYWANCPGCGAAVFCHFLWTPWMWSINHDTLLTYINVIKCRLRILR